MFSNKRIMTSTGNSSDNIKRFHELFQKIDTVIIGAGAGLSASAGLVYTGERLEKYFGDFASRYHFRGHVFRRLLSVRHAGRTLGVLEPVYLHQPVYGCAEAGLPRAL